MYVCMYVCTGTSGGSSCKSSCEYSGQAAHRIAIPVLLFYFILWLICVCIMSSTNNCMPCCCFRLYVCMYVACICWMTNKYQQSNWYLCMYVCIVYRYRHQKQPRLLRLPAILHLIRSGDFPHRSSSLIVQLHCSVFDIFYIFYFVFLCEYSYVNTGGSAAIWVSQGGWSRRRASFDWDAKPRKL